MDHGNGDISGIPVRDVPVGLYLPDVKSRLDAVKVVLVPVGNQDRLAVCSLDKIFKRIQLLIVDEERLCLLYTSDAADEL